VRCARTYETARDRRSRVIPRRAPRWRSGPGSAARLAGAVVPHPSRPASRFAHTSSSAWWASRFTPPTPKTARGWVGGGVPVLMPIASRPRLPWPRACRRPSGPKRNHGTTPLARRRRTTAVTALLPRGPETTAATVVACLATLTPPSHRAHRCSTDSSSARTRRVRHARTCRLPLTPTRAVCQRHRQVAHRHQRPLQLNHG